MSNEIGPQKRCSKCGETKSLKMFAGNGRQKDGHHKRCRACMTAIYETSRQRRRERHYKQEGINREIKLLQAQDRLEERRIKYNIACETKELQALARLAARQARLDDRELELALRREARQALREMRILELQAQGLPRPKPVPKKFSTREEIREYRRSIYYLRQARIKANGGSHTKAEIKALLQAQNYQCAYCKRRVKLTEDHIIPLVQGGRDDIANICMACGRCNRQKRARTPAQWIKRWYLQPPHNINIP